MTFEQLIQQQQPAVEQVIGDLSRKHFLALAEVDEFRRVVYRALERNSYELLRAFDGRSTWKTYLHTVLTREFFVFQETMWGDWRPSTRALRLGAAAMLLEELVARDRFTVSDAIDWMRTTHRVDLSRHTLLQYAEHLGFVPSEVQGPKPSVGFASDTPAGDPRLRAALGDAMALVSPDDRLILELRFRDQQPLTRIARMLKVEARPLQRRIETIKDVIGRSLVTQGIAAEDVEALLQAVDGDVVPAQQKWWQFVLSGPSK